MCMLACSLRKKAFSAFLCNLTILLILPFAFGGVSIALPIGKMTSSGIVSISGFKVPSGTAVLSGERIVAQEAPALIAFWNGSSVLLSEDATATFSRNANLLLIQAHSGTIGFNLLPGEKARIQAGSRSYGASESGSVGEIIVTPAGGSSVTVTAGSLFALDVAASAAQSQGGNLTRGGDSFTDPTAHWTADELKGSHLGIGRRRFKIVSNTDKTIRIKGTFPLDTGSYSYSILYPPAHSGMSAKSKAIIGVAGAGGAAAGIIAWQVGKSKS